MIGPAFSDSRRGKCRKIMRLADRAYPSLDQAKRLGNLLGGSAKCELNVQETEFQLSGKILVGDRQWSGMAWSSDPADG